MPKLVLDHEDFRAHMAPLTGALADYARATSKATEQNGFVPSATSIAMAELADERRWATDAWREPARNAHSFGAMLVYFLAEHLAGYAAIVDAAAIGPVYAHMPMVRAMIETIPVAHWLTDPTINLETRIKRSIAYRVDSARFLGRQQHLPTAILRSTTTLNLCHDYARRQMWIIKKTGDGSKSVGGESLPSSAQSFTALAADINDERLDAVLWNLSSATQHGTSYALLQNVREHAAPNGPLDPTGATAALMVDAETLAKYGLLCWQGCRTVVDARLRLMGWTASAALCDDRDRLEAIQHSQNLSVEARNISG